MKLLLLGGPRFLGHHVIEAALARGHEVTLFNRGRTSPEAFQELERLQGDRDGGLDVLRGRRWDAVVDTCGYDPRVVADSCEVLSGGVGRYCFVSTISVLADASVPGQDETAPVARLAEGADRTMTPETYGALKAGCEEAAAAVLGERLLVVRPGLIVGPLDPTDRFTWWPVRLARGGEVLAPGGPDCPTQFVDVRDLAAFLVSCLERDLHGTYHATGPVPPTTLGRVLETCRRAVGSEAALTWVPEEFLSRHGVQAWMEMPLWVPRDAEGMVRVDVSRAVAAGLTFRDVAETARDTLAWHRRRPGSGRLEAGLPEAREREVLEAWRERAR